jgi:hypothetical protein
MCGNQLETLWVWFQRAHFRHDWPAGACCIMWANHDWFWPFWCMLVCGRQLETLWVLSESTSGMTNLVGQAVGQTWLMLAILAHVGVCGRQLEALWVLFWVNFRHDWPSEACCGPRLQILAEFRLEFSNSVPIWWFRPPNYRIFIWTFWISLVFVHYVTLPNRPFCTTPYFEVCLGPLERVYLSLFGLLNSQTGCFRGS